MNVRQELGRKRTEIVTQIDGLKARIEALKDQVTAIDLVIALYDPDHVPEALDGAGKRRRKATSRLPSKISGINKNEAILSVLREANRPLSTADCTARVSERYDIPPDDAAIPILVTHVSAALNVLMKKGRVRQAGTIDGRRHLWEIAA